MDLEGAHFIVLGGSGLIGSAIAAHLGKIPGSSAVTTRSSEVDLRKPGVFRSFLEGQPADAIVVYAAGIPRLAGNDLECLQDNLAMVYQVLEACRERPVARLLFLSSVEVYGNPRELPLHEESPLEPETLYGVGKIGAEHLVRRWHRQTGRPVTLVRLPGIYGPGDQGRGFPGAVVSAITGGRSFTLGGDPESLRDYVYVEDVARAAENFLRLDLPEVVVNLASGTSLSLETIWQTAVGVFGPGPCSRVRGTAGRVDLVFDTRRLRALLPEFSPRGLEAGFRAYRDALGGSREA